jgi:hypothetical protein
VRVVTSEVLLLLPWEETNSLHAKVLLQVFQTFCERNGRELQSSR